MEFELKKQDSLRRESLLLRNARFAKGQMRLEAGYEKRILVLAEESQSRCCVSVQCEALISHAQRTRCNNFLHGTSIAVSTKLAQA